MLHPRPQAVVCVQRFFYELEPPAPTETTPLKIFKLEIVLINTGPWGQLLISFIATIICSLFGLNF